MGPSCCSAEVTRTVVDAALPYPHPHPSLTPPHIHRPVGYHIDQQGDEASSQAILCDCRKRDRVCIYIAYNPTDLRYKCRTWCSVRLQVMGVVLALRSLATWQTCATSVGPDVLCDFRYCGVVLAYVASLPGRAALQVSDLMFCVISLRS